MRYTAKAPLLLNGSAFAPGDTIDPSTFKPKKDDDPSEYAMALAVALDELELLGRVEAQPEASADKPSSKKSTATS